MFVLKLNTPFDPGMYDAGNTYPHVCITQFSFNSQVSVIEIVWEYGTMDASAGWLAGKAGIPQRTILQNDDFYAAIAATPPADSKDTILLAAARECYTILSQNAASSGDVVEIAVEPPVATSDTASSTAPSAATSSSSATETPKVKKGK